MKNFLKKLFSTCGQSLPLQFFRYLFAGGASFAVDLEILTVLVEIFSVHYLIAAAFAFCGGVLANYGICKLFVFPGYRRKRLVELTVFFLITLIGLGLTELILYGACDIFAWHYLPSKILATVIVLFWNFGAKKIFLYRNA